MYMIYYKLKKIRLFILSVVIIIICTSTIIISANIIAKEYRNYNLYEVIDLEKLSTIMKKDATTIIYFFKDNCSPCSSFKTILNRVIEKEGYIIYALNLSMESDEYFNITDKYQLEYTPTLVVFKKEKEIDRIEGAVGNDELENFLKKYYIDFA